MLDGAGICVDPDVADVELEQDVGRWEPPEAELEEHDDDDVDILLAFDDEDDFGINVPNFDPVFVAGCGSRDDDLTVLSVAFVGIAEELVFCELTDKPKHGDGVRACGDVAEAVLFAFPSSAFRNPTMSFLAVVEFFPHPFFGIFLDAAEVGMGLFDRLVAPLSTDADELRADLGSSCLLVAPLAPVDLAAPFACPLLLLSFELKNLNLSNIEFLLLPAATADLCDPLVTEAAPPET